METTDKAEYRIGEVIESLVGEYPDLTASALRFWEREGLLKPSGTTEGGQRLYTENDINKIRTIKELTKSGVSLNAIQLWFQGSGSKLSTQELIPMFPGLFPWMAQYFHRRNELYEEVERFLKLGIAQRQEVVHSRKSMLKPMGAASMNPVIAGAYWKPKKGEQPDSVVEKVKEELLLHLEKLGLVCPKREREELLYSETDKLLFALVFFMGKGKPHFWHLEGALDFFDTFGLYPELPWKDEDGHVRLENALFNLVMARATEHSQLSFLKLLKRAHEEVFDLKIRVDSKVGVLMQILKQI